MFDAGTKYLSALCSYSVSPDSASTTKIPQSALSAGGVARIASARAAKRFTSARFEIRFWRALFSAPQQALTSFGEEAVAFFSCAGAAERKGCRRVSTPKRRRNLRGVLPRI